MNVPFFDLGAQVRGYRAEVHAAIDKVIDSGQFIGGDFVAAFENEFADFIGEKHCIALANGLDALRLGLECHSIGPGDEVIVPAFTFYATILAVLQVGATPVPVEVELHSANLDPLHLEAAITERTRAVIPVHLYGYAANMSAIMDIANRHNLLVMEDAAQSHGSHHESKMTGSWGNLAAFSFYPTKNLGALGDAGALITSDESIATRARSRRSYGQGSSKYDHVDTGWNSRLDPIQAAILSLHLNKLANWTDRRRQIASEYRNAIGEYTEAVIGPDEINDSVWHHFPIRVKKRVEVIDHFKSQGVATDVHYPYSAYKLETVNKALPPEYISSEFKIADRIAETELSMPIGPWMKDAQVDLVCDALASLPQEYWDI